MNSIVDFKEISELDLEPIKQKLMHVESGEGWTREQANAVEVEYRRFLYLMKKFPTEQTSPAVAVDTFWHYHILDTMKYAADCEHAFGYFLHHYPYVGMVGEDAEAEHHNSGERMRELYEQTFAVSYNPGAAFCGVVRPPVQQADGAQAFCGIVRPPVQEAAAGAAFCGIVRPPVQQASSASTAFCGIVRPPERVSAASDVAFCGIVRPPAQEAGAVEAAFCGVVHPPKQDTAAARAAFCGIVHPPTQQAGAANAAFCGIVRPPELQAAAAEAAFCGIVRPPEQQAAKSEAAFCGIVRPPVNIQAATAYCALGKLPHGAKGEAVRTNVGAAAVVAH